MRIAVLGTGMVGRSLAVKLASLGHEVRLGTRDVGASMASEQATRDGSGTLAEWSAANPSVGVASFADAAADAEVVFNATSGEGSLDALGAAGNLTGKVIADVANALDFSRGMPPRLSVCNDDSLAEQIQRAFPDARVVKTLNTMTARVMVEPGEVAGGDHTVFLAGDDADAKATVRGLLEAFGWKHVLDLGGVQAARGMEMYLPLWLGLMGAQGTPMFNVKVST
jgi:8-hydroxy-5-deazaflavin:NADPH oxidoreductase